jgi:hypothetical protein
MTTTLRLFYAGALFMLAVAFLLFMLGVGLAFAQEMTGPISVDELAPPTASPAAPEATTKDLIDLIFSSAAAGAMSLGAVLMAFLAKHLPAWLTPILDWITTSEADRWERLITSGLDRAEAYARTKFDVLKDRAGYVNAMATFLAMFNREIVQYADKNGNGIIDLIETRLPPDPSPPDPSPPARSAFVPPLQPPMGSTARRGVKAREASH